VIMETVAARRTCETRRYEATETKLAVTLELSSSYNKHEAGVKVLALQLCSKS
jgi:hypothetical protein